MLHLFIGQGKSQDLILQTEAIEALNSSSSFSKTLPPCNIQSGNEQNELGVLVCFSYRSLWEGGHLGKKSED